MDILQNYQDKLFPYAYNILGSVDDALDVIQEVVAGFLESDMKDVNNKSAYLIKSVVNKSINLKKRNQKIVGDLMWLPEPIATENADNTINTKEIISYSMLVLLEYLSPKERAVFILKSAFDYSHQEIARLFSISVDNSKQLLSRAKRVLKEHGSDFRLKSYSSGSVVADYINVIKSGDVKKLEELLADHITIRAVGGGTADKALEFATGVNDLALLLARGYDLYLKKFQIQFRDVNNSPAVLFYSGSTLIGCQVFNIDTESNKILNIYFIAGRKKLRGLL